MVLFSEKYSIEVLLGFCSQPLARVVLCLVLFIFFFTKTGEGSGFLSTVYFSFYYESRAMKKIRNCKRRP